MFVKCHAWGYIPKSWREVKVCFIPKAGGRSSDDPKSVRAISQTSFMLKAQEKILERYIRSEVLSQNPLCDAQFAYQPGKSTIAALQALTSSIKKSIIEHKEYTLAVFLDIAGAFDNTSIESIITALMHKGVDIMTCEWIKMMLGSRKVEMGLGNESIKVNIYRGCPQGGVLSPLLWSMVIDELLTRLKRLGFDVQAFADDLSIRIKGKFTSTISERMQAALNLVMLWCRQHGLSVNPDKTEVILFTRRRNLSGPLKPLRLFGKTLVYSETVKSLGVILDNKLMWNAHVDYIIKKAKTTFWGCRNLAGKNWGLKNELIAWIYTAIVRPLVCYASIVWWERTTINMIIRKLNQVQRLACLTILGCARSTPTAGMERILGFVPLHLHVRYVAAMTNYDF